MASERAVTVAVVSGIFAIIAAVTPIILMNMLSAGNNTSPPVTPPPTSMPVTTATPATPATPPPTVTSVDRGDDGSTASISSLAAAGVDFSVPESDLADWLKSPDSTPYPAISNALLQLLVGHKLRRPVAIDAITWNYVHSPGVTSPRDVEDVDIAVLKKAVLEASNSRHGEHVDEFDKLLALRN